MLNNYILLLITLTWILIYLIYKKLYIRSGKFPLDNFIFFWLLAIGLYGTVPPLIWYFRNEFTLLDGRLFVLNPDIVTLSYILELTFCFLLGTFVTYNFYGKSIPNFSYKKILEIPQPVVFFSTLIMVFSFAFDLVFESLMNLNINLERAEAYAFANTLPIGVRQLFKLTHIMQTFSILIITIFVFQKWPKYKWLLIAYLPFSFYTFFIGGGRTEIAIGLLSILICYHVFVKELSKIKIITYGITGLIAFALAGIYRSTHALNLDFLISFGEFNNIFANAVELHQKDYNLPIKTRFSDLTSFIPSQFLWFEKELKSVWFLNTFYPSYIELGHGLGFGLLSELVTGYGLIGAFLKGLITSYIFIKSMIYIRKSRGWWVFPLNLFLCINIYQSVRDTSFRILNDTVQYMIFPIFIMFLIKEILFTIKLNEIK